MPTRLDDQAVWNSIATQMRWDESHETALSAWGVDEYFETWAALFPYDLPTPLTLWPNSAMTAAERQALQPLVDLLNEAWDSSDGMSAEAFLGSPWPNRIATRVDRAVDIMAKRGGLFSTVREEEKPTLPLSSTAPQSIYVPLLEEGTDVWRPADAEHLSENRYLVLGPIPEEEVWAFKPGSVVLCERRRFSDGKEGMTALSLTPT